MAISGKTGEAIAWRRAGFITGRTVSMRNEFRPRRTWLCKLELKRGTLPGLKMGRHPEAIGKQGLHHETHLVFRWISCCGACFNAVAIGGGPFRQMRQLPALQLIRPELICEFDVCRERDVRPETAVRRAIVIPGSQ